MDSEGCRARRERQVANRMVGQAIQTVRRQVLEPLPACPALLFRGIVVRFFSRLWEPPPAGCGLLFRPLSRSPL